MGYHVVCKPLISWTYIYICIGPYNYRIYIYRSMTNLKHGPMDIHFSELRNCVTAEVDVLGSKSLLRLKVSVDVKQNLKQKNVHLHASKPIPWPTAGCHRVTSGGCKAPCGWCFRLGPP